MKLVREVFRLKWDAKQSNRKVGRILQISKSTVATYLACAASSSITTLAQVESLNDEQLENMIFPNRPSREKHQIDFERIHTEIKRKNVTLMLLWQEIQEGNPGLVNYSHFCKLYRDWSKARKISMRQSYKAGERAFIDYAGTTIPIYDGHSSVGHPAQIFVVSLGASHYTYIEASWSQKVRDFLASTIRALEFFGGVPEILVPDNLKSAVTMASRYEPVINQSYRELAKHYGTIVLPSRVRRPKDKSIVEGAVLHISRQILARLRNRRFFSLEELNKTLWELLEDYNSKNMQGLSESRKSLFEKVEKGALRPLPTQRYEIAEWKKAKANIDYHIAFENNYYSVPYKYRGIELTIRYTDFSLEIFDKNKRIAAHKRFLGERKSSTFKEHMPVGHRSYAEWSPSRIINWAKKTGISCGKVCEKIMAEREHPENGYRSCLGIIGLGKKYTPERLENACSRALKVGALSYKSIKSILEKGLDLMKLEEGDSDFEEIKHKNIRGSDYYQ